MAKIIIIDGNSLLFRAFYATYTPEKEKLMRNKDGIPTNAIFAFSNMLTSIIHSLNKDDGIFVAFDKGAHTFRHKRLKTYKANRPPLPEELAIQMPIARELLDALNIHYYEDDDYEADDIAGNMAKKAEKVGYKVLLYTSDKDYLQLIDDNITVELIKKGLRDIKEMTPTSFKDEWGFEPAKIIDYKGLRGDPSDNLNGIPKVGDKTAKSLIIKYGSFEEIYNHVDELTPSLKANMLEFVEDGRLSKELAIINTDFPIPLSPLETIYRGYDFNTISEFAKKYNFNSLLNKLPKSRRLKDEKITKLTFKEIKDIDELEIPSKFGIGIDVSNDNYHEAILYGISLSFNDENYYIFTENLVKSPHLIEILESEDYKKYAFDFKKIKCVLSRYGINIKGLEFDLLLATYLIDSSYSNEFSSLVSIYGYNINYVYDDSTALFSTSNPLLSVALSYYPLFLSERIISKLKSLEQYELLSEIEQPLTIVLADMEIEGFPLDKDTLIEFKKDYEGKIEALKEEIYTLAGHEFNINSTKELGNLLYQELNLPGNKKGSTSVEYLKELIPYHPIVSKILDYRKYSKLLSTYVNGFLGYIQADGKIHATFNQAYTQTGRLSSSEPNLQNISIRDEERKQIRKAFFYKEDNIKILSLDYSQIELRILASLSGSESLIRTFNNDEDIHSATAKHVFHLDREPTSLERRKAKAVNFGIVYGISDWGLADQLEISMREAREIITSFNKAYPEVKEYLDRLVNEANELGYATTLFNRRRYFLDLKDGSIQAREFVKRAAMNAPIQGTAADVMKVAMIKVDKALKEGNYKSKIVSQIHDELIIKAYDDEVEEVSKLIKDIMENAVKLKVALKVDGGYASSWFDAK